MEHSNPDEISLSDEDHYDDPNDYEVASDPAMAAALGFTSFGSSKRTEPEEDHSTSHPAKKRRLNQHTNDEQANLAANRVQLKPYPSIKDEISYDDGDDFELDVTPDQDPDAPPTPFTSTPAETQPQATGNGGGSGRSTPSLSQSQTRQTAPTRGGRGNGTRGGGAARGGGRQAQAQGATFNPLWYVNYYDSSCNENPWEGMERHKGLAPVGTWLTRYWDTAGAAGGAAGTGAGTSAGDAGTEGGGDGEGAGEGAGEGVVSAAA